MATQSERRTATTNALRRAARSQFGQRGFDQTSIDDIATAAGVTRGALYHYFDSKEQLFEAVFEEIEVELVDQVVAATAVMADPAEALRVGCDAFLDATADPALSRIALIDAPAVLGWARYRRLDEQYFLALVRVAIDSIHPEGPPEVNAMAARALIGGLTEVAIRAASHPSERDHARAAAHMLADAAVRGVT